MSKQYVDIESIKDIFRIIKREYVKKEDFSKLFELKQDKLIDSYNIKTINNQSILGSGNLEIKIEDIDARSRLDIIEQKIINLENIDIELDKNIRNNTLSVNQLRLELENMKSNLEDLNSNIEDFQEEINIDVDNLSKELLSLKDLVNKNISSIDDLNQKLDDLQDDVRSNLASILSDIAVIENDISILKSSSSDYSNNASKLGILESEINNLKEDIKEVEEDIEATEARVNSRIDTIENDSNADHESIISLTQTKLSKNDFEYEKSLIESNIQTVSDNLNSKIISDSSLNVSEHAQINEKISKNSEDIASLEIKVNNKDKELSDLNSAITSLDNKISKNEIDINSNSTNINGISSELTEIDNRLDLIEDSLNDKQDILTVDTSVSLTSQNPIENRVVTAYIDSKTNESTIANIVQKTVKNDIDAINLKVTSLQDKDVTLNNEITNTKKLVNDLEQQIDSELQTLETDISSLQQDAETTRADIADLDLVKVNKDEIKTINGQSILGSGNIVIDTASGNEVTIDSEVSLTSSNAVENKAITAYVNTKSNEVKIQAINTATTDTKTYVDNNYYNKGQVDAKIASIATGGTVDLSNYATLQDLESSEQEILSEAKAYTDQEINSIESLLEQKQDKLTAGTNVVIENNIISVSLDDTADVDLTNYYTKSETYNKTEIDTKIANAGSGGSIDLSNYYTKGETDDNLEIIDVAIQDLDSRVTSLENNSGTGGGNSSDIVGVITMTGEQMETYSFQPADLVYCSESSDSFSKGQLYYSNESNIIKLNGTTISLDPAITSFTLNITGLESGLLEVGQSYTVNSTSYNLKKPGNITEVTLNKGSVIIENSDNSLTINQTNTVSLNKTYEAEYGSNTFTLKAITSNNGNLNKSVSYSGKYRMYYGTSADAGVATVMTSAIINNDFINKLSNSVLVKDGLYSSLPKTINLELDSDTAYYGWILVPSDLAEITKIMSGGLNFPFIKQENQITAQNIYGQDVVYNCYRSANKIIGTAVLELN